MKKGSDHVADQDADNDKDQGQATSDVQKFIVVERARMNPRKPSWLTTNMIVAYTLPVVEETILSTYKKAEINSESKIWKDAMMENMS